MLQPQSDPTEKQPAGASTPSALRVIVRSLLFPALGALLALWWVATVYLTRFGLGTVERNAALGRHLESEFASGNVAACLGNSIVMEGIDAAIVESTANDRWRVENLAMTGASPTEFQILLPRLLKSNPRAVVMGLQPSDIGTLPELHIDKAYAYAYGGFVADWPEQWGPQDFPGIGREAYRALTSTYWDQVLHFRRAPLNALNDEVRLKLRTSLRPIEDDDWRSPFQLLGSMDEHQLTYHLRQTERLIEARLQPGTRDGVNQIRRLYELFGRSTAMPVFVIGPVHPRLAPLVESACNELRGFLKSLAEKGSAGFADASNLLTAADFADGLHPNASGREKYSRFLGRTLADLSLD